MRKEPIVVKSVANVATLGYLIHFHLELKSTKSTRREMEGLALSYFGFGWSFSQPLSSFFVVKNFIH